MVPDAEACKPAPQWANEEGRPFIKLGADPRASPLGHWLRKCSLDDEPQFWNVQRGERSLVGSCPVLRSERRDSDAWQQRKLDATPGAISLRHLRGQLCELDRTIRLELEYQDRASMLLDLSILVRGIGFDFAGKNG